MQPDQYAQPAFILSIVGLAIAIIGAATGITSLVWQIITRTRGAHRVQVRVTPNMKLIGAPVVSRLVITARSALTSSSGVFGRKNARGTDPNAARMRAFENAFSLSSAAINAAVSGRIPRTALP